jgi:DNA polymerase III subunit epsilon
MQSFSAIDFETATGYQKSASAVGIVTVENGRIVDEFYSLIQPPGNEFWWQNIRVNGITPQHTRNAPFFTELYPEIKKRLECRKVVAHNESFDRNVLKKVMNYYYLDYSELNLPEKWECTLKIYKAKGFKPTNLHICCQKMGIDLIHHEALSDARAAAKLYLLK